MGQVRAHGTDRFVDFSARVLLYDISFGFGSSLMGVTCTTIVQTSEDSGDDPTHAVRAWFARLLLDLIWLYAGQRRAGQVV
jgi:hypothetical protein